MKRIMQLGICGLAAGLLCPLAGQPAQRSLYADLRDGWSLSIGQQPARRVSLPLLDTLPDGAIWLRRSVPIPASGVEAPLAILLGTLPGEYEVYVNGHRIGATPDFNRRNLQQDYLRAFPVPPSEIMPGGELQIGLLVLSEPRYRLALGGRPTLVNEYALLDRHSAARAIEREIDRRRLRDSPRILVIALDLSFAAVLLLMWRARKEWRELLWLGIAYLCFAGSAVLSSLVAWGAFFHPPGDLRWIGALSESLFSIGEIAFLLFTWAILGIRAWPWIVPTLACLPMIVCIPYFPAYRLWMPGDLSSLGVAACSLLWALLKGWPGNRMLMLLGVLFCASFMVSATFQLHFAINAGPFDFRADDATQVAIGVLMVFELLRRSISDRRERERLSIEMDSARLIQQELIPRVHTEPAGPFALAAIYEPAHEVGGDFYWTRATPDGSLLVVVGDVSGKGLKAAMLVSVAIGILRNEKSASPAGILGALNEGLAGHTGGGFVTCCCARFGADGTATAASAGHPPPYGDGQELELEAGLPLGLTPGVAYREAALHGDCFTFVSDGVVESANGRGELFGFERTRTISGQSAPEIADAAKAWGQNDDITVVTVRRNA